MNIFALHPDPAIAASMHCDQHLHKMILESAQMLSVALIKYYPDKARLVYKPAYEKHPCTQWLLKDTANIHWLLNLCYELENIRQGLGCNTHSSMDIVDVVASTMQLDVLNPPYEFIFCGPDGIRLRSDISIHQKYHLLYTQKYRAWLDTPKRMSYKNRPLPDFLSQYKDSIPNG